MLINIKQEEINYRQIVESMYAGLCLYDKDGITMYVNPRMAQILGYNPNEMIGKHLFSFTDKKILNFAQKKLNRRKQGISEQFNIELLRKNGSKVYTRIETTPRFDIEGKYNGGISYITDISEQKISQDALQKSKNLIDKIFDILPVGLWISDKNGKLIRSNKKGREIWGAEPLVGQDQYGVFKARRLPSGKEISPDDWALAHSINSGETIVGEMLEIDGFNGKKKIILNYTSPVIGEDGKVEAGVIVNLDISKQSIILDALLESEITLIEAQKIANIGSWTYDLLTQKVKWSRQVFTIFGRDPKDGELPYPEGYKNHMVHPDDWEKFDAAVNRAASKGIGYNIIVRYINQTNGKIGFMHTRCRTQKDMNGKAIKLIGTCQDVTERIKAQEEIKSLAKFPEEDPNLVGRIDYDGKLLYCNHAYKRLFNDNHHIPFKLKDATKKIAAEKIFNQKNIEIEIGDKIFLFNLIPIKKEKYVNFYGRDITKLKAIESVLIEKQNQLQVLLDYAPDSIYIKNKDSEFILNNRAHQKILGVSNIKEVLGKTDFDFFPQKDAKKYFIDEQKIIKTGKLQLNYEEVVYFKNLKKRLFVSVSRVPFEDSKGKIIGIIGISRDISEMKKTEEALSASESKYRELFESAPIGFAVFDNEGKINSINEAMLRMRGIPKEAIIGRNFTEIGLIEPKDIPYYKELFTKMLQGKITKPFNTSWHNGHGEKITGEVSATLLKQDGKVEGFQLIVSNITERKQMEQALEQSKNIAEGYLNIAAEIIVALNSWGNITLLNDSGHKLLGYSKGELIGKNWFKTCLPNKIGDIVFSKFKKLIKGNAKNMANYENNIKTKSGETRIISWHNALLKDSDGNITGTISSGEDITSRKKAEEEIRHLSFHDHLTGLYNRRFFEEELIRLDTDRQLPLSFIMGDLNGLKLINDVFGHTEGDRILKESSEILKKVCRSDDILARWGGDEFVILLPKTNITDSEELIQRIKKEFKKTDNQRIPISLSLGSATKETKAHDIQTVIIAAESNMYKNKLTERESISSSVISSLESVLYEKSNESRGHMERIRKLAIKLGKKIMLASNQLDELSLLASLHDLGKVAVPETILAKKSKLTEKEWEIVKRHPEIGFNIAQSSPLIAHIAKSILSCHENWDGSGYPQGLKEESIPMISRIILIADTYDVMINGRNYEKPIISAKAIEELKRCAGTQFDPVLVEKFIEIISNI